MNAGCSSQERLSLGAYVLGALDPIERAEVEAHLSECVTCRDELAGLAAMPGLLSRVRLEDVLEPPASPSPASTQRLIGRLRAARRTRRRRIAVATSAVALAATAAVGLAVITGGTGGSGSAGESASIPATSPRTGVAATFAVRPASWGTAVRVRLRGVRPGTQCRLIAVSRDGHREVAGTWRATYDGTTDVQTATAISKDQLASFEVVTTAGRRLLRAHLE
jgi:anti-sigma factor RsiW